MLEKTKISLDQMVALALEEDIPAGDLTTEGLSLDESLGLCQLVAKQNLVLCGSDLFQRTLLALDSGCEIQWKYKDGMFVEKASEVCSIRGDFLKILKAERVALNFLGHLSGISTLTAKFVAAAPNIKILDTRKTLPLYRSLQKQAVLSGGGFNHRMNLSDAVLIKENHIYAAGGLESAVNKIKRNLPEQSIEVEVKNIQEVEEALLLGAHRLLLDNMSNEELEACLKVIPKHVETEASGNMNLERVKSLNNMGLDYISVGALTHSATNADFSLLIDRG